MTLRHDDKQWLIYEEAPVAAAVKAVEVLGLITAGTVLKESPEVEVRAVANLMLRWADARVKTMGAGDEYEQTAVGHITTIMDWLSGGADPETRPDVALSELHASAFSFDSTLMGAGITGDGWFREIARGEHGR